MTRRLASWSKGTKRVFTPLYGGKIGDYHYAEDITARCLPSGHTENSPTLKNPDQFAGWLYIIANRLCIDWTRRQKRIRTQQPTMQSLEGTRLEEIEASSYAHHISEQRGIESAEYCHARVQKLLDKLPENERAAVTLFYLDEMPTKEISKVLGVSVNTIASRLHRARKRLQVNQEPLVQEVLDDVQLSDNLKENIMNQLKQLRSTFDAFMEQVKSDPASREAILKEASDEIENALKGGHYA